MRRVRAGHGIHRRHSILATDRLRNAGYDLEEIGEKILDNYASQILDHGFFHADPHPGNLLVRSGKIVYIDLGIMGRLSPRDRAGFGNIIQAVGHGELVRAQGCAIVLCHREGTIAVIDHTRFLADLDLLLNDYGSCDVADIDIGAFLNDILMLTRSCKVTLPSSITSVSRGIVTLEGTVMPLIPNENMVSIINAHIQRTKDGVWVLSHDANIKRMTDGYGDIHNMTYEKLQSYSYDNGANIGNYPGLKLATFSQALDECAKYQMIPCVEIKKRKRDGRPRGRGGGSA